MPSKLDKYRVGRNHDGRVRVTEEIRESIRELKGKMTQRDVAEMFGVSRRTVFWIWNPEAYDEYKAKRKEEKPWRKYYETKKHTEYTRRHRDKKRELLARGEELPVRIEGEQDGN